MHNTMLNEVEQEERARRREIEVLRHRLIMIEREANEIARRLDELAQGAPPRVVAGVLHA